MDFMKGHLMRPWQTARGSLLRKFMRFWLLLTLTACRSSADDRFEAKPLHGFDHAGDANSIEASNRLKTHRFFRRQPSGKLVECNTADSIDANPGPKEMTIQVEIATGEMTPMKFGKGFNPAQQKTLINQLRATKPWSKLPPGPTTPAEPSAGEPQVYEIPDPIKPTAASGSSKPVPPATGNAGQATSGEAGGGTSGQTTSQGSGTAEPPQRLGKGPDLEIKPRAPAVAPEGVPGKPGVAGKVLGAVGEGLLAADILATAEKSKQAILDGDMPKLREIGSETLDGISGKATVKMLDDRAHNAMEAGTAFTSAAKSAETALTQQMFLDLRKDNIYSKAEATAIMKARAEGDDSLLKDAYAKLGKPLPQKMSTNLTGKEWATTLAQEELENLGEVLTGIKDKTVKAGDFLKETKADLTEIGTGYLLEPKGMLKETVLELQKNTSLENIVDGTEHIKGKGKELLGLQKSPEEIAADTAEALANKLIAKGVDPEKAQNFAEQAMLHDGKGKELAELLGKPDQDKQAKEIQALHEKKAKADKKTHDLKALKDANDLKKAKDLKALKDAKDAQALEEKQKQAALAKLEKMKLMLEAMAKAKADAGAQAKAKAEVTAKMHNALKDNEPAAWKMLGDALKNGDSASAIAWLSKAKSDKAAQGTQNGFTLMQNSTTFQTASTAGDPQVQQAQQAVNSAGGEALNTAAQSAAQTAANQSQNSWANTINNALVQSIMSGGSAMGSALGSAAADKAADALFGPPGGGAQTSGSDNQPGTKAKAGGSAKSGAKGGGGGGGSGGGGGGGGGDGGSLVITADSQGGYSETKTGGSANPTGPYADAIKKYGQPSGYLSDGRPYWGKGDKNSPYTDHGIPPPTPAQTASTQPAGAAASAKTTVINTGSVALVPKNAPGVVAISPASSSGSSSNPAKKVYATCPRHGGNLTAAGRCAACDADAETDKWIKDHNYSTAGGSGHSPSTSKPQPPPSGTKAAGN
ncbi:MAG: hypothetical protein NTV49_03545 [Kiritimatiellaeota bacterium]|nr:hypothetical protein [Kiritimatiellota bacterium]